MDEAAHDEITCQRDTVAFATCDLLPSALRSARDVDPSVSVLSRKSALPVYCSVTAVKRLFHHEGERASAAARRISNAPQAYQFYFHKSPPNPANLCFR